jgi:hypothetical protein
MNDAFPGKRMNILLATFLVPSFLYWTSGLHKEGLIFTGISLIIYSIYFGSIEKKWGFKRISALLTGLLLLLFLRNFILVIIIPAIIAWLAATRWPKYGLAIFTVVYVFSGIFFFVAKYADSRLDFPQAVVNKQQEFIKLKGGNSSIPIKKLEPNAVSFLKNTPQAINLSTIRPYPSDVRHILSLAASLEINLLLLLFLVFIVWHRNGLKSRNLIYFCIFFSFSVLLAIGFSVNNLGAIVRYRSIIMPFLIVPMLASLDWSRVARIFSDNIKYKNNINNILLLFIFSTVFYL